MEVPPVAPDNPRPPVRSRAYFEVTRTATYSFLISVPLLIAYELLIAFANRGQLQQVRVGAEVWVKQLVALTGATGVPVLAIVVITLGVVILLTERKKRLPIIPKYFGVMLLESLLYAVVLAFLVASAVGMLFAMIPGPQQAGEMSVLTQLALSLGAGLYEELVFRVLLVGGLFWMLKRLMVKRPAGVSDGLPAERGKSRLVGAYVLAAVIGAILFSAVHYTGALGDSFTLSSFTFRFLFGLALNAVFLLRGFGIAAWAHALYDVLVVLGVWG